MANLTVNYDFGSCSLVSASAYSKQNMDMTMDARDTLSVGLIGFGVPASAMSYFVADSSVLNIRKPSLKMSSQELRLVSNGDQRFKWTLGGYYKNLDRHTSSNWLVMVPNAGLMDDSTVISDTTTESFALFGEGDWKLSDTITVTAGLRQYSDDRSATADVVNYSSVFGVPVGVYGPISVTEKQTTYNAIISWKASETLNVFVRAASGFRSGGPNLWVQDPVNIPKDFKAERLQSLEAGIMLKPSSWLSANAYVFDIDWKDKQVNMTTPSGLNDYLANASTARSQGMEFELQVHPTRGLSLSAALTYTEAKITQALYNSTHTSIMAKDGSHLPYSSPWEFKAAADYRWPLVREMGGVLNLNYCHRGDSYSDISNVASSNNGNLDLLNLRTGIEAKTGSWGAYVFVRNLTDSQSIASIQQATGGYGVRYPSYIQPRTIGIELQFGF
jgi:iron complex outermembrane recepter protein